MLSVLLLQRLLLRERALQRAACLRNYVYLIQLGQAYLQLDDAHRNPQVRWRTHPDLPCPSYAEKTSGKEDQHEGEEDPTRPV